MLLNEIVKKAVQEHSFVYIKQNEDGTYKMEEQEKSGFTMLDVTTASVINAVFNAISQERQNKLNNMPLMQAISLCWKCTR